MIYPLVGLTVSIWPGNCAACPHTSFLHFGTRDSHAAQSLCSLGFGLTTTLYNFSSCYLSLSVEQTAKMPAHTFETIHTLNVARG
ncbi:hypothetical protein MAK22_001984 [Klebsiella aerogenes]|nr:hypothetical protein [Klebsiella aerogenes]EIV7212843.1 hypothetical protein [Klebsiella aerogenes]EKZ5300169.1 hypothetical protein [Klebsiella aerogenes]